MAKRFTSTEIWSEDWFLDMPSEYKLFWYYMLSECDFAGFFKVNVGTFCKLNQVKITADKALEYFNTEKDRIRVLNKSLWLIEDFFCFQYGNKMNEKNPLHKGIIRLYNKFEVSLTSIRGLFEGYDALKEKEKEDCINTVKHNTGKNGKIKFSGNFKTQGEELLAFTLGQGEDNSK